jgi:hypothetical protein
MAINTRTQQNRKQPIQPVDKTPPKTTSKSPKKFTANQLSQEVGELSLTE